MIGLELLKIDNDKLKISLTREDMEKYALDFESFSYDNTETRRAFWSILDDAKHETGFDAAVDTVSVQVYGGKSGGCEMYVTRTHTHAKERAGGLTNLPSLPQHFGKALFGFAGIDDLLSACKTLDNLRFSGKSSAYFDEKGYYLQISDGFPNLCGRDDPTLADLLCEFGTRLSAESSGYIIERTRPICIDRAVPLLSALAR